MTSPSKYFNGTVKPAKVRAKKIAGWLSIVFNRVSDRRPSYQYAADFAHQAGLRNIAGRYVFSEGVTPNEIETVLGCLGFDPRLLSFYRKIWMHLKSMNPGLGKVRLRKDSIQDVKDAILGVTSGYNTDDIVYYIALKRKNLIPGQHNRAALTTAHMIQEIETKTGIEMRWIAAPSTLIKIRNQLRRKKYSAPKLPKPKA